MALYLSNASVALAFPGCNGITQIPGGEKLCLLAG